MDMATFIEKLVEAVDFPEPFDFKADTHFQEVKYFDSLAALGIILMFDGEFSITFTPADFERFITVQDLYDYATGKIS